MKKGIIILVILVILVLGYGASAYNGFVKQNVAIDGQWAQVDNQYQRRFDLIPNLEASVKGAFTQEQEVFGAIAEARTRYAGAGSPEAKAAAANEYEGALARLLVVMEQYPTLNSLATVQDFMVQLEGTENRLSVERMRYNEAVRDYNTSVKTFPSVVIAGIFGFDERTYLESAEEAATAPKVSF